MKPFAKRLLALTSAAAITLSTIPAVYSANDLAPMEPAEQWAAVETENMDGLIPAQVRSAPVAAPLTRQGVCGLVMNSYKTMTGLSSFDLGVTDQVFTDTKNRDILCAYQLGLVRGRSAGIFDPEGTMTRQDFWTVAASLLESVGYPYIDDIEIDLSAYSDGDTVIAYAKQPVRALLCLELIHIPEGDALNPAELISSREAVMILDRLVSFYSEWVEDPVEPQRYLGEEIAEFALKYVGCRYVYGAKGPNKFDCSGFVYYVYKQYGYKLNPGARNQWKTLDEKVKKSELLPGDIVFFSRGGKASNIFHVGIYIGDGKFVHAANSRKGVIVSSLSESWYANRYHGAKRAIG